MSEVTANSNVQILDLDTLVPTKRIVKLGGKEFDVSAIPMGLAFEVMGMRSSINADSDDEEKLKVVSVVVAGVLKHGDPDITPEWVNEHLSINQVMALVQFISDTFELDEDGKLDPTKGSAGPDQKAKLPR